MPTTRRAAARLLSTSELGLFDASRRDALARLDARALKGKIERTRKLRDRARDLFQRQRLKTKERSGTKAGKSGAANVRTQDKAALLTELLQRFEDRLKSLTAPPSSAARKGRGGSAALKSTKAPKRAARKSGSTSAASGETRKSPKAPKAPPQGGGPSVRAGFMDSRAKALDTQRQVHASRGTAIHAHIGSRNRRSQARRDSR